MARCFFADMNSFFASVEQQECPPLRGKPVIVVPMVVETTCAIAASYEAKALGIKTGTGVKTARKACPEIAVVAARPDVYLQYHQGIVDVLNRHFVDVTPLSVDEMAARISRLHPTLEAEAALATRVKSEIRTQLGDWMRCSVGIAPNVFLSKVASDRQKPDGLTIYHSGNLPDALFDLDLLDLPGIANRMLVRLNAQGIRSVRDLWDCDIPRLRRAWGSIVGARWYWMLRGSQEADYGSNVTQPRKSLGHSHVLPPDFRHRTGAQQILLRLFSKALRRLREYRMGASAVEIRVDYVHKNDFSTYSWRRRSSKHIHANTEARWLKVLRPLLDLLPQTRFNYAPLRVSLTFSGLLAEKDQTLSLFDDLDKETDLARTVDRLNDAGHTVDLASVFWLRDQAPKRIPFGPPR